VTIFDKFFFIPMKTPLLLVFALVLLVRIDSFCQREYQKGYIIKVNGDSIAGEIAAANLIGNGNSCHFRSDKNAQDVLLSPLEIKAYGSVEGDRYESKMLPLINAQVFVHTLLRGKMSLYKHYKMLYVETEKIYPLLNADDKKGDYIKTLNTLVSECGLSADKVKYNDKDVIRLIQQYNTCKGGGGLKYLKKSKLALKLNGYLFCGYELSQLHINALGNGAFQKNYAPLIGIGTDLSSTVSVPDFFVNLEVSYSNKNYLGFYQRSFANGKVERFDYKITASWLRIPVGFGYRFSRKSQTSYVKIGVSEYYVLKSDGYFTDEKEQSGVVNTSYSHLTHLQKGQVGFWISVGFNKNINKTLRAFVECRGETTNGFLGNAIGSLSSVKSITGVVGIKF
jgi:hypothetical protein